MPWLGNKCGQPCYILISMKSNDILWKAILEDFFDDFLRFFVPNADDLFDFGKGFEFLDKELEQLFPPDDDNFSPQFVDKLVKVTTNEGNEECVFVHVEVQGYADKDFALRMFQYYARIWDKHSRPITAFAIFVDNSKNFHPTKYKTAYLGTEIYYKFNTFLKLLNRKMWCWKPAITHLQQ